MRSGSFPLSRNVDPVPVMEVRGFLLELLRRMEVPDADGTIVADCLLYSELRGHDSHGIVRLPVYGKRILAGVVKARPAPKVVVDAQATAVVDGDNGLGPVVGWFAMGEALKRARRFGIGFVVAGNSNHYGASGYYTDHAARSGCLGFSASNAPPNMVPWGGRERFLGTNPFSIAIPQERPWPINADMATSVVARGNIIMAADKGEPIPPGWAIDTNGSPTIDANAALKGSVLPFAGPKGAALSFVIDIVAGVLSGSSYGRKLNTPEDLTTIQRLGHAFGAIEIARLMPEADFTARVEDLVSQLKDTKRAPDTREILAPGEPEALRATRARASGISISEPVQRELAALARQVGVPVPSFLEHP